MLQRCEGGVDAALQYTKNISKYMKDLIGYLEKRTTLGETGDSGWVLSGAGLSPTPAAPEQVEEESGTAERVVTFIPDVPGCFSKGSPSAGRYWGLPSLFTSDLFLPEMEFAKGLQKMASSCKQTISQEVGPGVPRLRAEDTAASFWPPLTSLPAAWERTAPGRGCSQSPQPSQASGSSSLTTALDVSPSGHAAVLGLRVVGFLVPQANMPFLSIYLLALEQDMEHGTSVLQAASTLQNQTFLQVRGPRVSRKGLSWAVRRLVDSLVLLPRADLPETARLCHCWVLPGVRHKV